MYLYLSNSNVFIQYTDSASNIHNIDIPRDVVYELHIV